MDVADIGFRVGSGRIAALRVLDPARPDALVEAVFTAPLRTGQVRVPPPRGIGWLTEDPAHAGLRWASSVLDAQVVDCTGRQLGRVELIVVDHLHQQVTELLLDDGSRIPVDDAAFLGTDRILVDADTHLTGELDLWLAWQHDLEDGRLWWRDGFEVPPPLQPLAAAAL